MFDFFFLIPKILIRVYCLLCLIILLLIKIDFHFIDLENLFDSEIMLDVVSKSIA